MQGRRRFLTLGGHRRSFAFISLAYLPCSGPPLENIICALRPSRVAVLKDRIPIFAMFCLHVGQLYVEAGLAGPAGSLPALASKEIGLARCGVPDRPRAGFVIVTTRGLGMAWHAEGQSVSR
jgi:hypothetical protein